MQLICLGDSLTYGYGVKRAESWPALVRESTGWSVLNLGVNGDTTGGMLIRFNALNQIKSGEAVFFIMGGFNDILYCGNTDVAKASIGALLQQVAAKGFIPVVGIPSNIGDSFFPEDWSQVVDFEGAKGAIDEYRKWLISFCKAFKFIYVDFEEGFDKNWLTDGIHPNKEGHAFMAEKIEAAVKKFMH